MPKKAVWTAEEIGTIIIILIIIGAIMYGLWNILPK
jgi:hypothetical protein